MNTLKTNTLTMGMAGALMCLASNLPAQDVTGRWYLGLDAGLALQQDMTIQGPGASKLSFDPGFRFDLSGGVHLLQSLKAEIELGFIFNAVSSVSSEPVGSGGPDYSQVPMMVNAIYTLPLHGPVSAYVGAGVGGVWGVLWHSIIDADDSLAFGYQGILGVKYALSNDLDLGLSYKFLGTAEHDLGTGSVDGTMSHSILAALTFKF